MRVLCPSALLVILCGILTAVRSEFVNFYMDKTQGATVSADSVRVETSLTRVYQSDVNAWVTVTAASGFPTLTANFRRFDLEGVKPDGNCYDYFNIYDGNSLSAARLNVKPLCGNSLTVTRYNSSGTTMTFKFVTDNTAQMTGVEVIVTSAIKGACTDSNTQFQCSDKVFCISSSLRCDAYKHCVDGSDEDPTLCAAIAAEANSILYGIIIGSVVGGIALILLFTFLIYYCVREHKYKRLLAKLREERLKKNRVGPVVENEYPVTNRYRKREFKAMFRNEDIENKDWGLYHSPLYDAEHFKKLKVSHSKEEEEKRGEKVEGSKEECMPVVDNEEELNEGYRDQRLEKPEKEEEEKKQMEKMKGEDKIKAKNKETKKEKKEEVKQDEEKKEAIKQEEEKKEHTEEKKKVTDEEENKNNEGKKEEDIIVV